MLQSSLILSGKFDGDSELANLKRLHQRNRSDDWLGSGLPSSNPVRPMENPKTLQESYRAMGLMLGTWAPAAIFWKIFGYGLFSPRGLATGSEIFTLVFLLMNFVCAYVGYRCGDLVCWLLTRPSLGRRVPVSEPQPTEYRPWLSYLVTLPLAALVWGVVTGAAGGVVFFGIGAIFGAMYAVPIAVIGISVFSLLHRWLQRDGLIESSHLWAIVVVVTVDIVALIVCAFSVPR